MTKKIDGRFELSYRKYNDYADDIFEYSFTTDPDDIIVSITFELNQTCVYDVCINVADYSGEYEDERDTILKDGAAYWYQVGTSPGRAGGEILNSKSGRRR